MYIVHAHAHVHVHTCYNYYGFYYYSIKPKVTLSPTSTQQPNKKKLHSHKQSLYDRPTQRRVTPMVRNTLSTGTTEQSISVDKGAIGGMVRIESQRFPKRPSLPPLVCDE